MAYVKEWGNDDYGRKVTDFTIKAEDVPALLNHIAALNGTGLKLKMATATKVGQNGQPYSYATIKIQPYVPKQPQGQAFGGHQQVGHGVPAQAAGYPAPQAAPGQAYTPQATPQVAPQPYAPSNQPVAPQAPLTAPDGTQWGKPEAAAHHPTVQAAIDTFQGSTVTTEGN